MADARDPARVGPATWPWLLVLIGWALAEGWCRTSTARLAPVAVCAPLGPAPPPRTAPGPAFWRAAPGLGRTRAPLVAQAVWSWGADLGRSNPAGAGRPLAGGPAARGGPLALRALLESLRGIGPITADRVLQWLRSPEQGVHSDVRGP